ncbi:MAG: TonB-dependent receptor plug domain-containing protein, partial [Byssovorax sp.]
QGTRPVHRVDAFNSGGTAGRAWVGAFTVQWFYHRRLEVSPVGAYGTVVDNPRTQFTDTRMMTELRFEPDLSSAVQLMTRAHAHRYVYQGNYRFTDKENHEDFAGTWFGGEARVIYTPSARLRITGGGEGQLHPQATLIGVKVTDAGISSGYLTEKQPYNFGAGYAIIEASPVPWLRLSGGARVDVYSTFGPIVVPRAAAIIKPNAGGALKIMGGRAFRAPSIYEQVYTDGETQVRAVDPARGLTLGPESIYSGEIEYSQRFAEDWVALGAVHASYLQGIVDSIPNDPKKPDNDVIRYANSPPAVAIGGDVEVRHEWRRGWMLAAMYGYQRARFLDGTGNTRLLNAPEHLASFRGVVPMVRELASLGLRVRLEAPRRIRQASDETTKTAAVLDATVSGALHAYGLRYVVGVYNVTDWRFQIPVTKTFASRTLPQNGRTFLIDLIAAFP